ncbi:MAG: DNA-methyltransferase [Candidatus Helarchaeota archaeon]
MPTSILKLEGQTVYFKSSEAMDELDSETVQLIVTSPPYWNVRDYGGEQLGFGQSYQEYVKSLNRVWNECIRVLKPNGKIAVNFQPLPINSKNSGFNRRVIKNIMHDVEKFMQESGLYLSSMFFWDKSEYINTVSWGSYPKPTNIYSNTSFEEIFIWVKPGNTRKIPKEILDRNLLSKEEWRHWAVRCIWDDISPVIKINSKGENRFGHSAPFPEDIPYRVIKMHTVEGELVLDPFLGSGTTLKMCRILNRKGIGYEINSKFRSLIENRIQEDWTPPSIEPQYKTIGTTTFGKILTDVIEETLAYLEDEKLIEKTPETLTPLKSRILKKLEKKYPRLLSKAFLKKV